MNHPLPERLVEYLIKRDAVRASAVTTFLNSLTDRERALVSDIAVMGYVRGSQHREGEPQPKRPEALAGIVDACFSFPDLYPAVDAVGKHVTDSKTEYFVEIQQLDLSWIQGSGTSKDYTYIAGQAEIKRAKYPDEDIRIGWRITSTITGALPRSEED